VAVVPVAPVQLEKRYSPAGVAVILTVASSLYCPLAGVTVPPVVGLAEVVKVYFIGAGGRSSSPDEQELISEILNKSRNIFFIAKVIAFLILNWKMF
jgi:hypothetical protein